MTVGRFARWYRWVEYAAFGRSLERRRFAHLHLLRNARRILVLGEGDGRALQRLCAVSPGARIDVVEVSPEMIALAKRRSGNPDRVALLCQDARTTAWPAGGYDAIVTQFFLDCFSEDDTRDLIRHLTAALARQGIWLISEFTIPPGGWRRLHARIWVSTMYRFFRNVAGLRTGVLPPIEALMKESRMQCVERQIRHAGMIVSEVWKHES